MNFKIVKWQTESSSIRVTDFSYTLDPVFTRAACEARKHNVSVCKDTLDVVHFRVMQNLDYLFFFQRKCKC